MPYIITMTRDLIMPGSASLAGVTDEEWAERNTSRRAVATLEEVNTHIAKVVRVAGLCDIGPEGGEICFPDGTTIKVASASWTYLRSYCGIDNNADLRGDLYYKRTILYAWNAKHGTEA